MISSERERNESSGLFTGRVVHAMHVTVHRGFDPDLFNIDRQVCHCWNNSENSACVPLLLSSAVLCHLPNTGNATRVGLAIRS